MVGCTLVMWWRKMKGFTHAEATTVRELLRLLPGSSLLVSNYYIRIIF